MLTHSKIKHNPRKQTFGDCCICVVVLESEEVANMYLEGVALQIGLVRDVHYFGELGESDVVGHASFDVFEQFDTCTDIPSKDRVLYFVFGISNFLELATADIKSKLWTGGKICCSEGRYTKLVAEIDGNLNGVQFVVSLFCSVVYVNIALRKQYGRISAYSHNGYREFNLRADKPSAAIPGAPREMFFSCYCCFFRVLYDCKNSYFLENVKF